MSLAEVQKYWDNQPCNINHSDKEIGTKEYYDEVEKKKYFVEPHIPEFAEFDKYKGKKVLEIGCGIGTDGMNFLRAGADYYACDISEKSLDMFAERAELEGFNPRLKLSNGENVSHIFPNVYFDLVYSFGVIHHTPNPQNI